MLAAAVGGSRASLKVNETVRALATVAPSAGVEATTFIELMSNSLFAGPVYAGYGSMIAERRYSPPGFRMPLGLKDLGLAEELAAEKNVTLPTAPILRDRFEQALADAAREGGLKI